MIEEWIYFDDLERERLGQGEAGELRGNHHRVRRPVEVLELDLHAPGIGACRAAGTEPLSFKRMFDSVFTFRVNHGAVGVMHDAALMAQQITDGDHVALVGEFRDEAAYVGIEAQSSLFDQLQRRNGRQRFRD